MEQSIYSILAFVFSAAVYFVYVRAILKGKAKPTLSSWISFLLIDAALLAAMLTSGTVPGQMIAYVCGVSAVIIVSLMKKATLGWTRIDTVCTWAVVVALVFWAVFRSPDVTIVISLIAITIGSVPMWVNLRKEPTREPLIPWLLVTVGGAFGVLAIRAWTVTEAVTPVYFFILQIFTVTLILRRFKRSQAAA